MSIRTKMVGILALGCFLVGCQIHTCEHGAVCEDEEERDRDDAEDADDPSVHETCIGYCARLSVCGAPQAESFEHCIEACEQRFEVLPERTRQICECAEWSRCGDVIDGRCSEPPPAPSGGACSTETCGSGGGASSGGASMGGTASAGASGSTGATGGVTSTACAAACDCPAAHDCVDGACVAL